MAKQRHKQILEVLKTASEPVNGSSLAEQMEVSRQIIVQDVAILRARGHEIIATPRGYLLPSGMSQQQQTILAVKHTPQETEKELNILVDNGLTVIDVVVEHSIYGELRGNLMLSSRRDVQEFMDSLKDQGASLLSSLTGGSHLHTVQYRSDDDLQAAIQKLRKHELLSEDPLDDH